MAGNKIEESQQQSQGITIGTQGHENLSIPQGTKGSHHKKEEQADRKIPNQDRSSASNQEQATGRDGSE